MNGESLQQSWPPTSLLGRIEALPPKADHSVGMWDDNHKYHWQGGPAMPSVTGILRLQDALMGGDGLTNWAAGIAADYVLAQPSVFISSQPKPRDEIRADAVRAVGAASRRGSAVHGQAADIIYRACYGVDSPHPVTPTAEAAPYIYGLTMFMAEHRPQFIESEQVILNLRHQFGGRLDFIAKLTGRIALVDIKTGKLKRSQTLQLGGYDAPGNFIGRPDDPKEYPLPRIKDHYVLLLREGSYELVPMAVTSQDRRHFLRLAKTYHAAKAWERTA